MQRTIFPKSPTQDESTKYNAPQGFSMEMGFVMIIIALSGLFWPEFFNLNLSIMHSLVLAISGLLAIWSGLTLKRRLTFYISLGLGVFFLLNAVLGVLVGEPGVPRFGFFSEEEIKTIAPGFLELSTYDHVMHGILSLAFLWDAFFWKKRVHPDQGPHISKRFMAIAKVGVVLFIIFIVLLSVRLILGYP
jgi:hypothetical protein